MDEKKTLSKEQKRVSLFMGIALSALLLTNASFVFTRQDKFSSILPLSIALCGIAAAFAVITLVSVILSYKKLSEKKRSIIGVILTLLLCGAEIWMCVFAVNDLKEKRNAENSAVLFIKDKYGIDAAAERIREVGSGKFIAYKMTAGDKGFTVGIFEDENGNTTISDNYQIDEIMQAVFDEVSRVYPDGILRHVGIYGSEYFPFGLSVKRFDGTNLDEVIDGNYGSIDVNFVDTKFDLDDPIFKRLNAWGIKPRFTSFDTRAHLEEFVASGDIRYVTDMEKHYAKYAPCIIDRVTYDDGRIVRKMFDLRSQGDIQYCYVYGKKDDDFISPGIDIAENGMKNIEEECWEHRVSTLAEKPLSNVYAVHGKSGTHFIYCPLEFLNNIPVENIGALYIRSEEFWVPEAAKASVYGDYAVFELPYSAKEFVLVDTTGIDDASGA